MELLSWDLISPIEYSVGEELNFNLHFEAPADTESKKFYVLGGLYTPDETYIAGSLFGILKAAGVDYGVNDTAYTSIWELDPEEGVDLPCKFNLSRTNCLLALFLVRMVGDEPNIDDDEELAQIQAQLVSPIPVGEQIGNIISQYAVPLALIGMMVGVVTIAGRGLFKE